MMLTERDEKRLKGVHEDLRAVVLRAAQITKTDFMVVEGLRTEERQRALVKAGASRTMNSKHLTGRAVDLAPLVDGKPRWDWPLFYRLADAMKAAAAELGVKLTWGGDWKTFKDGPHFELQGD